MEEIKKALTEYDLSEMGPINLLRESGDNIIFVVGAKERKILRISKRLPIEDVKFEYEAVQYLSRSNTSTPKWLLTKSGNFYTLINDAVVVLFNFLDGHHVQVGKNSLPTPIQAFNAGKELGLMSNAAAGFTLSLPRKRNIFSELRRALSLSDRFIDNFEGGKEFINQVKAAIEFGESQNEASGLIHNDYRPSNVFFNDDDNVTGVIDFDWSCIGPIIKDLALSIVEWSFPDGATEVDSEAFESFLGGYNSVANYKHEKGKKLYSWIQFATLSDTATYFCDRLNSPNPKKKIISSFMYQKYTFFSKL